MNSFDAHEGADALDAGVLARFAAGTRQDAFAVDAIDPEALVLALFDELGSRLMRYCRSFGVPRQDAEDVVQEAFLALFRHLRLGRSRENLRGWLFRVSHHLALKRRIQNQRMGSLDEVPGLVESVIDPAPGAEELLAWRSLHEQMQAVLAALPERDRRCLLLKAEGMRYREIARLLGMSLGAVSGSIARSLARMRRAHGEEA